MRVRVKICGITDPAGIDAAVRAGADAVGFVLAESPRRVTLEVASALAALVPPFVTRVAVLHHADVAAIRHVAAALAPHWIQTEITPAIEAALAASGMRAGGAGLLRVVHDGEAVHPTAARDPAAHAPADTPAADRPSFRGGVVLFEAPGRGGRGVAADWDRAADLARRVPLVLAGGLTAENVGEAIRRVRPYGVDVSSGVESSPGIKDPSLVTRFVAAVRRAEADLEEVAP